MSEERNIYSVTVSSEESDADVRIDTYLSDLEELSLSRSYIRKLIDGGSVSVFGKTVKASYKVSEGDEVRILLPELKALEVMPAEMDLDIIYEDNDLLIVNKPKGLSVHPGPGHTNDTLVNGLMAHCGDSLSGINGVLRPGIVHRIDKDTSGLLAVCKNDAAHRSIAEQLAGHSITRVYYGITTGTPKEESGTIETLIGRDPKDRKKMSAHVTKGKRAVTHYRVEEALRGYALCSFRLETGRTHQIRVHMASIGHPLAGDTVYGAKKDPFGIGGQALHAAVLGFVHPGTGEYMEFSAPLPAYFEDLLSRLR